MARNYAQVKVSVWQDDDFRALPVEAQHLYFLLLTAPTLNLAGVTDWRPNRTATLASGWTPEQVERAAEILADRRYIVVDPGTEEVLIRTLVKHDGILRNPKTAAGMVSAWTATYSRTIRQAIAAEVDALSDGVSDSVKSVIAPVLDYQSDWAPDTQSDTQSQGALVHLPVPPQPQPQPATDNLHPSRGRATSLPKDWAPSESATKYAEENGIDLDHQVGQFKSHHLAKGSTFKSWDQAFRNWLGNAKAWSKPQPVPNLPRIVGGTEWEQ